MNKYLLSVGVLSLSSTVACVNNQATAQNKTSDKPNVIFILADDLGYGDISCYGQKNYTTPNIDALAASGMTLTQHYSGSAVSAASRSVLMTGQHTGHTPIRANVEMGPDQGQLPLPDSTYTMAEMFKDAGYATGAFGKWGLGMPFNEGGATHQGFDTFCGYYCQSRAHRYFPEYIWEDEEKLYLEGNDTKNKVVYAPNVIHQKALNFIRKNAESDKPFFAYIPYIQPHAELIVPEDEMYALNCDKFEAKPFVNKSKGANYGDPDFVMSKYASQPNTHAAFATMVQYLDRYVGDVVALVKELGIEENTMIVFSSDNGPHAAGGGDNEFFDGNGPFRGMKFELYEGGIRIPMIVSWKGHIASDVDRDHISAFWDFMPTFSELVGGECKKPVDGISLLPTLLGQDEKQKSHEYLYWEFPSKNHNAKIAVRIGDWKAVQYNVAGIPAPKGEIELYHIVDDIAETRNLADENPDIVAKAKEIFKSASIDNANFPIDR